MRKSTLLSFVAACFLFLLFTSLASAADPKAMVEEIFETKEAIEKGVRGENWTAADTAVTTLDKQMKELVSALQVGDADKYNKQITLITDGMRKAIADKEDEEYEEPAHAAQDVTLKLMANMDYPKPPVFILIQRQVEESLELVEDGDFEALEEEMEEIVNLRDLARESAKKNGINGDKVDVVLDLAWDISRDADAKNAASAKKRLERMNSILESV